MQIVLKHIFIYYFTSVGRYYFFKNHIKLFTYLFNEFVICTDKFTKKQIRDKGDIFINNIRYHHCTRNISYTKRKKYK